MKRRGVRVVPQKHNDDCGIACLAMLFDLAYGDVAAAARLTWGAAPRRHRGGLGVGNMEDLAWQLGKSLRRIYRKDGYLAGQTGVLGMNGGKMDRAGHWVVLKGGTIVDPAGGTVWDVTEYCARHRSRTATLLVETARTERRRR